MTAPSPNPNETPRPPQVVQARPTFFPYFVAGFAAMITRDIWRPILSSKLSAVVGILFAIPFYYHLSVKRFEKIHRKEAEEFERTPPPPFELPGHPTLNKVPYPLFPKFQPKKVEEIPPPAKTNKWGDEISE
eukprot:TRINITY_DN4726_c0_g1_i1.p1 TRINITY_DN4726_c0_g1~~TRINITY_DN4726_c0_g1_i1.p1  ORF type:complete len:132 (-),score=31.09 TRINITY_DN4726_c0_g1_i1:225-620(-)